MVLVSLALCHCDALSVGSSLALIARVVITTIPGLDSFAARPVAIVESWKIFRARQRDGKPIVQG